MCPFLLRLPLLIIRCMTAEVFITHSMRWQKQPFFTNIGEDFVVSFGICAANVSFRVDSTFDKFLSKIFSEKNFISTIKLEEKPFAALLPLRSDWFGERDESNCCTTSSLSAELSSRSRRETNFVIVNTLHFIPARCRWAKKNKTFCRSFGNLIFSWKRVSVFPESEERFIWIASNKIYKRFSPNSSRNFSCICQSSALNLEGRICSSLRIAS